MDNLSDIFGKITWGSVPTWGQFALLLAILWKGVPAFLDAVSNRQSKIEERMGALLESATARFEAQLAASDKRHEDCMAGQERLRIRVSALEDEVDKLRDENAGLKKQRIQGQVSAIRSAPDGVASSVIEDMVQSLENKGFGG